MDKPGSDQTKHQAGNQLHDDAVEPQVDGEHAGGAKPCGLWDLCVRIIFGRSQDIC